MFLGIRRSAVLALSALLPALSFAATVTYDFDIEWMTGNPDGFDRPVIGINGQWPPPVMYANIGDQVVVHANNKLGNATTSLHFHGMFQNGTTEMDGAAGATQCGIPIGTSMTYNFTVNQPGTYWYHSHVPGQYPEGLRAPFIIHDPKSPYAGKYDEEIILSFSDWYHEQISVLSSKFLSVENPSGAEPVPNAALMNDTQNLHINIKPGKTYLFRMVSMAAFAPMYVWFEGHTMSIVEVDGVYTQQADADQIYIAPAQRYSVLITTKNDTTANFPIVASMDEDLFDKVPDELNPNVTSWLTYNEQGDFPDAQLIDTFNPFDDFTLVPYDQEAALPEPGQSVNLTFEMDTLGDGANYALFNGNPYISQKVPAIYSAMSLGDSATNPDVYGVNANAFVLDKGEVVEIILNNADSGKHPFHLHGHNFQVIARSDDDAGAWDPSLNETTPDIPMKRDVILVRPGGYVRIRFVADNPGVWLFHCHIEWHMISGLIATFIEAPKDLQSQLKIPDDHYAACKAQNIPTAGNAAGNLQNPLDLTGANVAPAPLPAGFTARGIVAMVFSVIAAFLGMAVIAWYGYLPLKE